MKSWMRIFVITSALLGAMGASVWTHAAETGSPMATSPGTMMQSPERMRERMTARHNQRMNELKAKLHLDASQEAAWKTFTEAMQPPSDSTGWPDRAAMSKLTTPERVDQMQAWHQRMEEQMKKRGDATKNFYAALNNEQKKVFDAEAMRMMPGGGDRRMQHHPH